VSETLHTSEEICEALVRHVETTGSESFGKNFIQGRRIRCTVWCVLGDGAEEFCRMAERWLAENGYGEDL
jgi:hypothetical protein